MFDVNNVKHRLLASATTILAGTAAAAAAAAVSGPAGISPALGIAVALTNTITSLAGNFFAGDVQEQLRVRIGTSETILRNRELESAVGQAIARIVASVAVELPEDTERSEWQVFAAQIVERWLRLSDLNAPAEFSVPQGSELFAAGAGERFEVHILDPQSWKWLLDRLAENQDENRSPYYLSTRGRQLAGERLYIGFASAFRKVLQEDFSQNGRAYPAMVLLLLTDIYHAVNEFREVTTDTHLDARLETVLATAKRELQQAVQEENENVIAVIRGTEDRTLTAFGIGKHQLLGVMERVEEKLDRQGNKIDQVLQTLSDHSPVTSESGVVYAYLRRMIETHATFQVPSLNIRLPVEHAWDQVRWLDVGDSDVSNAGVDEPIGVQVARYHEWERLADDFHSISPSKALDLLPHKQRLVLIGGPGSGKSTLLRRIAYEASRDGNVVWRVSLRAIAREMAEGRAFADAAALSALTSALERATSALMRPDILLADGLDETDPNRSLVAQSLTDWAVAHPECRIWVTTRPIGHDPSLLPGFQQTELLPLRSWEIRNLSRELISVKLGESEASAEICRRFLEAISQKKQVRGVASVAARNPLLLTFLIQLHLAGHSLDLKRSRLFRQIIEIMRRNDLGDRVGSTTIDSATAWHVAGTLGWMLVETPAVDIGDLFVLLGQELSTASSSSQYESRRLAETALRFWEERRLVERVSSGFQEAVTFVHLQLGEYAASQHISRMNRADLESWLQKARRQPKWRQPILLACGEGAVERIVPMLLNWDNPEDPCSTEVILAAAGLVEAEVASLELLEGSAKALQRRLTSPIPFIAIEAAIALVEIAPLSPDIVLQATQPLLNHEQRWTQLAAMAAALTSDASILSLIQVRDWLDHSYVGSPIWAWDTSTGQELPNEANALVLRSLVRAAEHLFQEKPRHEAAAAIKELIETRSLSHNGTNALIDVLWKQGCSQIASDILKSRSGTPSWNDDQNRRREAAATCAFARAVLTALNADIQPISPDSNYRPMGLGALYDAFGFPEAAFTDWQLLGVGGFADELQEVIRGCLFALKLDAEDVVGEANMLLGWVDTAQESVYSLLPHVPADFPWEKTRDCELQSQLLVRALLHPSVCVKITAGQLLWARVMDEETAALLRKVLDSEDEKAIAVVAAIAEHAWGENVATVLLDRLDGALTAGCEHLFEKLPEVGTEAEQHRIRISLLRGLHAQDSKIAVGAAKALVTLRLAPDAQYTSEIQKAWEHWQVASSWCRRCKRIITGNSCTKCRVVADRPYAALLEELQRLGQLGTDQLLSLCKDANRDVSQASIKLLVELAGRDQGVLVDLVQRLQQGSVSFSVLNALLALPASTLEPVQEYLLNLLRANDSNIRRSILKALPAGWADRELALEQAKTLLIDKEPRVRSVAVRILRVLQQNELPGATPSLDNFWDD